MSVVICPRYRRGQSLAVWVWPGCYSVAHTASPGHGCGRKSQAPLLELATFASPAPGGGCQQRTCGLHPGTLLWDMVLRKGCSVAPRRGTALTVTRGSTEPASQWDHPPLPWCRGALEAAAKAPAHNWARQSNSVTPTQMTQLSGSLSITVAIILGWETLATGAPPPYSLCFLTTTWAVHGNDHPIALVWGNHADMTHILVPGGEYFSVGKTPLFIVLCVSYSIILSFQ